MLVDSHAHLDFYTAEELPAVLANAQAVGLGAILSIGIGDGPSTMHRALGFANTLSTPQVQIFASAGIHPQEAAIVNDTALARLEELAQDPRCIAIGEIGLDYYHLDNPMPDVQKQVFSAQMKIAAKYSKPIILHCRTSELAQPPAKEKFAGFDAADDLLTMLEEEWAPTQLGGILHCFSGTVEDASRGLQIGFYLSFAGNVTYPKTQNIRDAAMLCPADRILVETDSPFLTPVPLRGQRNEPAHTAITARYVAELRKVTTEELAKQTTENFHTLFPATRLGESILESTKLANGDTNGN